MKLLPLYLQLKIKHVQFVLPVWHAAAHVKTCEKAYSLKYKDGVGKVDGEGIERTWAALNPFANSTKEMGSGRREDFLDDAIGAMNFEKCIQMGTFSKNEYWSLLTVSVA